MKKKENKDTYDFEEIIDSTENVVQKNFEVGHFKSSIENADTNIEDVGKQISTKNSYYVENIRHFKSSIENAETIVENVGKKTGNKNSYDIENIQNSIEDAEQLSDDIHTSIEDAGKLFENI